MTINPCERYWNINFSQSLALNTDLMVLFCHLATFISYAEMLLVSCIAQWLPVFLNMMFDIFSVK